MQQIKLLNSRLARRIFSAALLGLAGLIAGCSMVDTPATAPVSEPDVRNYYIQLARPNAVYNYTVVSNAPYHPATGTLTMNMEGIDDTFNGNPIYTCLWSYATYGAPEYWFYSLCADSATNLGVENAQGQYIDSWVDLEAPLALNKSWTFTSLGEQVTATVIKYRATAQVNGQTYNDVVMVNYAGTGDSATIGTEWFQRGKGIIYSNINRPKFGGMVENQLISMQ